MTMTLQQQISGSITRSGKAKPGPAPMNGTFAPQSNGTGPTCQEFGSSLGAHTPQGGT